MAEIDDTIRRIQSLANSHDKALTAAVPTPQTLNRSRSLTYGEGTRVLDLVTGQEGTVINGNRQNVIVPATGDASSGNADSAA